MLHCEPQSARGAVQIAAGGAGTGSPGRRGGAAGASDGKRSGFDCAGNGGLARTPGIIQQGRLDRDARIEQFNGGMPEELLDDAQPLR